jgi:hypothetical protein
VFGIVISQELTGPGLLDRRANATRPRRRSSAIDAADIENRLLRQGNGGKGNAVRVLSFHSFKHTAATQVFNAAALKEITRRVTNHAGGGVVDRYIHEHLEAIKAATQLIPRLPKLEGDQK